MAPHPDPARPPNRSRRLLPWILGGVCAFITIVVVLVLAAGAVWYFALRETPQSVVEDYFATWEAADCERYEEVSTEAYRGEEYTCEFWQENIAQQKEEGIEYHDEVVSSEVDGDRATVHVEETVTKGSESTEGIFDIHLVREDGSWRLDSTTIIQEPEAL